MGTTLTNIHIDITGFEKAAVIEEISAHYKTQGYIVPENDAEADTILYLMYKPGIHWLAISEKDTPAVSIKDLKKRALQLAVRFRTAAIASMVYDSDALVMYLHSSAQQKKDLAVLDPEFGYQEELGYNPKTSKGKAKIWSEVLGCDEAELKSLWDKDYVFSEEQLNDIGELIGIKETADFYIFDEEDKSRLPEGYELIELKFSAANKKDAPYEIIKDGSCIIKPYLGTIQMIWDELQVFSFINTGGPHKGALFYLHSDLFADDEITAKFKLSEVELQEMNLYGESKPPLKAHFEKMVSADGRHIMIAYFPEFPIPEGIIVNKLTAASDRKRSEHTVVVRFHMSGDDSIKGTIRAYLMPLGGDTTVSHWGHTAQLMSKAERDKEFEDIRKRYE